MAPPDETDETAHNSHKKYRCVTTSQAQEFEIANAIACTLKLTKAFDEKVAHIKNYNQSILLRSQATNFPNSI